MSGGGLARRTLTDLLPDGLAGRRALVRVDFNVPLEGEGDARRVASDARIRATLPTVKAVLGAGASAILASHLGRPGGRRVPELSLRPVARRVEELLERRIVFLPEPFDPRAVKLVRGSSPGDVVLLENLRFEPGETANDPAFAAALAEFGELFVQDAFGTVHRAHASTVGVPGRLETRVAGLLVARELAAFRRLLETPARPFVAVLGGAKVAGKLETVSGLAERCDAVCLGGGMANTFLTARGIELGDSLVEPERIDEARRLLETHGGKLSLPIDAIVAREVAPGAATRTVAIDEVEPGWRVLDVGPRTVAAFEAAVERAKTIFWNGPMGVFETPPFDAGTRALATRLAAATERGAYTVVGGGDSLAALEDAGLMEAVGHASTGGGAALELLSGARLPGIEALDPAPEERG